MDQPLVAALHEARRLADIANERADDAHVATNDLAARVCRLEQLLGAGPPPLPPSLCARCAAASAR